MRRRKRMEPDTPATRHPLQPEFQAVKDAVPAESYGVASGRAWFALNRKSRRRKYAIGAEQ